MPLASEISFAVFCVAIASLFADCELRSRSALRETIRGYNWDRVNAAYRSGNRELAEELLEGFPWDI